MEQETFSLIAPLLEEKGIGLDSHQLERINNYADLLLHWNRRINLVGDGGRIFSRHILDSLMLETLPRPSGALKFLDIGSGAGLPGLVTAVMHPFCHVTALDKAAKKISFLQIAALHLKLDNFLPCRGEVNALAGSAVGGGAYDIVLARAFADLGTLLALAVKFLRPGGELWAMKGQRLSEEQEAVPPALLEAFEQKIRIHRYDFPRIGAGGTMAVYRKTGGAITGA